MAAIILACFTGPAQVVGKMIFEPILHQFNCLWNFTSIVDSLKAEVKRLDDEIQGLQLRVNRATEAAQVILPAVNTWLTESNYIKAQITAILSEAENVGSGCSKLGARLSLSKRAKETTDRSTELLGRCKFEPIANPGPPAAAQKLPRAKTLDFESRRKMEEAIMTTLRGRNEKMIAIYGMGGLGKTTMAERIRNSVLDEHVFGEVVMAVVSQQADTSKIQVDIGKQLGLVDLKDETSLDARLKLHSRLSGTKRSLVILDDVWKEMKLEELGIPCDSDWCTILITSRNKDALSKMSVQKIFEMEVLSEDEAWVLFGKKADISESDDTNLNSIAKQVMKECGGLPLALTAIGLTLKGEKDLGIWKDTLGRLGKVNQNTPEFIGNVYGLLKLSYELLPYEEAKSVFLLCCLFPEDSNIPLDKLTYFSMGLGILEDIDTLEEARDRMCSLIGTLKSRSLLLDSDEEDHVRIHDLFRDVCIHLAKQKGYIGGNDCAWISSSLRVGERSELLTESRFPNLRLLSLTEAHEEFEFGSAFLEGIKDLYVLCINSNRRLTSLPHATHSLVNLKTLSLVWCRELKTISIVGKLVNLEILICHYCQLIEELPLEMKGLNRLKLLDITGCWKLQSIGRGIISSLVGLEKLKMLWSFNKWEAEDREERQNAALRELEALTNLRCLEIEILDRSLLMGNRPLLSEKIDKFIIRSERDSYLPYGFRKGMSLCLEKEGRLGDWIEKQLLKDTEFLWLRGDGANNVDLAKSQNIRRLELRDCESMKNVVTTSGGDDATVFPSIEQLELESLPELQEICDGPISSTSFQNLKALTLEDLRALTQFWKSGSVPRNKNAPRFSNLSSIVIRNCYSLRNVGQLSMAGKDCLPQLEYLVIIECQMMEQVFLWNNEEVITKVFPKLKEVELYNLPNLTTFYQGIQGIQFPLLTTMKIEECPKMKSIIMASNENNNSGEITSSSADQDIDDDDDTLHLFCQSEKVSFGSSLEILEMNHNPFCRHEIPSSLFNGLEELTINKYEGSLSIFTLSVARNLVSLRELRIWNCAEMIKVIEDEQQQQRILLFPKLRRLELKSLPKLVSFCEWKCDVQLPSLTKVDIEECPNMESFSLGFVVAPNLEFFAINDEYIKDAKELNGARQQCLAQQEEKRRRKEEEEGGEEEQETKDEIEEEGEDDHN